MTDISFDCSYCGKHLIVDEAGAGIAIDCPQCGKSILIPEVQDERTDIPRAKQPPSPKSAVETPVKRGTGKAILCAIIAVLVVLLFIVWSNNHQITKALQQRESISPVTRERSVNTGNTNSFSGAIKLDKPPSDVSPESQSEMNPYEPLGKTYPTRPTFDVDFLRSKLNGRDFDGLTIDSVTSMMGRPSDSETHNNFTTIDYSEAGISFAGYSPRISEIKIYLIAQVEDYSSVGLGVHHFSAFTGQLPKGVDKNWKIPRFLEAFKENGATDTTDENAIMSSQQDFMDAYNKQNSWVFCQATIRSDGWTVIAFCDPSTRFLNTIYIISKRN